MKLARVDSNTMVDLSKKAYHDSRSLKTITVLTLIYLPASFASVSRRCNAAHCFSPLADEE